MLLHCVIEKLALGWATGGIKRIYLKKHRSYENSDNPMPDNLNVLLPPLPMGGRRTLILN